MVEETQKRSRHNGPQKKVTFEKHTILSIASEK
jgi:hypothetical protein